MTTIKLKNGSGAPAASDLVQGEPALDLTNKRLYSEDASGNVIEVGTNPTTLTVDTDTLVVDASNNRVGIGTTSPDQLLHLKIDDGVPHIRFERNDTTIGDGTSIGQIDFEHQESGNAGTCAKFGVVSGDTDGSGEFLFQTGLAGTLSEKVRIDKDGNVGIGTDSPGDLLHIKSTSADAEITLQSTNSGGDARIRLVGNSSGSSTVQFQDEGDSNIGFISYLHSDNAMTFRANDSEKMRIDSSGNVGIGTTSPDSALVVHGVAGSASRIHISSGSAGQASFDGSGSGLLLTAQNMNTTSKFTPAIQFGTKDTDLTTTNPKVGAAINAIASETYSADSKGGMDLAFYTTPDSPGTGQTTTERMRIDSGGHLLLGKTSTGVNTAGVELTDDGQMFATSSNVIAGYFNRQGASGTVNLVEFRVSDSDAGKIKSSAGGTPVFAAASDERLKDNITDHESELLSLMALRPVRWDWKDKEKGAGEGFVAQELEQTAWADLVSEDEDGYKMVSGLGAVETRLIKALQEAVTRIETLEAEVAALKGA